MLTPIFFEPLTRACHIHAPAAFPTVLQSGIICTSLTDEQTDPHKAWTEPKQPSIKEWLNTFVEHLYKCNYIQAALPQKEEMLYVLRHVMISNNKPPGRLIVHHKKCTTKCRMGCRKCVKGRDYICVA